MHGLEIFNDATNTHMPGLHTTTSESIQRIDACNLTELKSSGFLGPRSRHNSCSPIKANWQTVCAAPPTEISDTADDDVRAATSELTISARRPTRSSFSKSIWRQNNPFAIQQLSIFEIPQFEFTQIVQLIFFQFKRSTHVQYRLPNMDLAEIIKIAKNFSGNKSH